MKRVFYWDDDNETHIWEHGVERHEAETVVVNASAGFPRHIGDDKQVVWGQTGDGRYLQVIFVLRPIETVDIAELGPAERLALQDLEFVTYVIHARDLTAREKRQLRRARQRQ